MRSDCAWPPRRGGHAEEGHGWSSDPSRPPDAFATVEWGTRFVALVNGGADVGVFKNLTKKTKDARALKDYESALAAWEEQHEHVSELLEMATNLEETYRQAEQAGFTVRLKPDEHILIGLVGGSGLIEPRSSGGRYQGGSRGVSVRVAKGVRFRVGAHRGTYVPGPDVQKAIDTGGDAYVTTQRVLYTSPERNREWLYKSTVDVFHSDEWVPGFGVTYLSVTNRQKTSGFAYPMDWARTVRDRVLLGMAVFDGTVDDLTGGLQEQHRELLASRPTDPKATATVATKQAEAAALPATTSANETGEGALATSQPAGWYADPSGRHGYRFWDGRWTEHVADAGVQSVDPV